MVPEGQVEEAHERASDALAELIPDEWTEDDSQSDFDLIALTLDRMESAVNAGEYTQAEQARLEAYAFFEFGPELSLRSIAPHVVAEVEGLVWFGAEGKDGLAKLIAQRRPGREVRETRLALDEALEEGAGSLGEGASTATVVTNAAVIVFREGLEAALILAAVMASLERRAQPAAPDALRAARAAGERRHLRAGPDGADGVGPLRREARGDRRARRCGGAPGRAELVLPPRLLDRAHLEVPKRRRRLLAVAGGGLISAQVLGFVLLGFSTVYREGFETVLFLQALELNSGPVVVLEGVLLGGLAVMAVAVATFVLERKLPYKKMLIVTGVLLTAVLVIMVGKTVRTMQGVGWIPITPIDVELPYWLGVWLGTFPTVETAFAQVGAAVFVVGSYLLAERLKRPTPRPVADRAALAGQGSEDGAPPEQPVERAQDAVAPGRVRPHALGGSGRPGEGRTSANPSSQSGIDSSEATSPDAELSRRARQPGSQTPVGPANS